MAKANTQQPKKSEEQSPSQASQEAPPASQGIVGVDDIKSAETEQDGKPDLLAQVQAQLVETEQENTTLRDKLADAESKLRNTEHALKDMRTAHDKASKGPASYGDLRELPALMDEYVDAKADDLSADDVPDIQKLHTLLSKAAGRMEALIHSVNEKHSGDFPPFRILRDVTLNLPHGASTDAPAGRIYCTQSRGKSAYGVTVVDERTYNIIRKQLSPDSWELYHGPLSKA